MASSRNDPRTRYPLPPLTSQVVPANVPWDVPISDLAGLWLEARCCHCTLIPMRLMAADLGWKRTLRSIVPKLRCKHCGGRPASVRLLDKADGDGRVTRKGGALVLVEPDGT